VKAAVNIAIISAAFRLLPPWVWWVARLFTGRAIHLPTPYGADCGLLIWWFGN